MKRSMFAGASVAALMSLVPNFVLAATEEGGNLPLPGDYFNLWLWVALAAVGAIGFLATLYFLLVPTKRGKYERVEEKHKN